MRSRVNLNEMSSWRVIALGLVLAAPRAAAAQTHSLQGQIATTAGVTDNANLAPSEPEPGQPGAVTDGFSSVSPMLVYTREGRRAIHALAYRFDAQLFFQNSEANSYTNQLDWNGLFLLTRRARLGTNLGFTQGETNNFQVASQDPGVEAAPAGGLTFVNASAGQSLDLELSQVWRLDQQLGVRTFFPLGGENQASSYDLSALVRSERTWARDAVGALVRGNYFIASADRDDEGNLVVEGQQQLIAGPEVTWRRDAGAFFSFALSGGVQAIARVDDFSADGVIWQPTASAVGRLTRELAAVQASYSHSAAPNLLVREVFVNDTVELSADYPLSRSRRLFVRGALGGQRVRQVNLMDSSLGGSSFVYLADATLAWGFRSDVGLALRYQFRRQDASAGSSLQSFAANTVLVSLAGRYPDREARRDLFGRPSRVDRGDVEDPFGDPRDRREGGARD
jgi:hypothetical protein